VGGISPLGAILRGKGVKINKWDNGGAKQHQGSNNAQPQIDH